MLNKKEIKAHKLAIQYMYSGNHLEMARAVSEVSAMGQKYYSMFVKYAEINIFNDKISYYKSIGDRADRLERYVEGGVLLKEYQSSDEDLDQFILCRLLAFSSEEELSEMDDLGILVAGVNWHSILEFKKMKDAKKLAVVASKC